MSIRELREKLQGPRRKVDTLYGRLVMRRFSVYLTAFFAKTPATPSFVTLLSLAAGLWGAWRISQNDWLGGILLVNVWYLLDHVDGELARLKQMSSATGLYFDTIANALVSPLTFAALGFSLYAGSGSVDWFVAGLAAAYGSLMLLVIPYCESTVILQKLSEASATEQYLTPRATAPKRGGHGGAAERVGESNPRAASGLHRVFRNIFSFFHTLASFPLFLAIATALIFTILLAAPVKLVKALEALLLFYSALLTVVWTAVLLNNLLTAKIDRHYESYKK